MTKTHYNPTLTLIGKKGDVLQVSATFIYLICEVIISYLINQI